MIAPEPAADPARAEAGWLARLRTRHGDTSLRFMAAGALNTAVGLAAYPALLWTFPPLVERYMLALVIAQAGCLVFAFTTYKLGVFRTRGDIVGEFGRFASFYLVNYAANWIALPVMVEVLAFDPVLAQFGFTFAVIIGSYFWHRNVTFRSRRSPFGDARDRAVGDE